MSTKKKKVIFSILLAIGLIGFFVPFILIFTFNIDYDGLINNDIVAFIICIVSIYFIIGGCIGLYRISDKFKIVLRVVGEIFWWLP